jgi:hypothetical protein
VFFARSRCDGPHRVNPDSQNNEISPRASLSSSPAQSSRVNRLHWHGAVPSLTYFFTLVNLLHLINDGDGIHVHTELASNRPCEKVVAQTKYGPVRGGRTYNGAAVLFGEYGPWCTNVEPTTQTLEIHYALSPRRFEDPQPLPPDHKYEDKEYTKESPRTPGAPRRTAHIEPHFRWCSTIE